MSGFDATPYSPEHAARMQHYLDLGYPPSGAWFAADADMRKKEQPNEPKR